MLSPTSIFPCSSFYPFVGSRQSETILNIIYLQGVEKYRFFLSVGITNELCPEIRLHGYDFLEHKIYVKMLRRNAARIFA